MLLTSVLCVGRLLVNCVGLIFSYSVLYLMLSQQSAATGKRSVRARSPSVSQQIMLDSALPKSGTCNTSAVISSTPAVVEEDGTSSHDTGAIHDGSYIAASNGMSVPWCMFY